MPISQGDAQRQGRLSVSTIRPCVESQRRMHADRVTDRAISRRSSAGERSLCDDGLNMQRGHHPHLYGKGLSGGRARADVSAR